MPEGFFQAAGQLTGRTAGESCTLFICRPMCYNDSSDIRRENFQAQAAEGETMLEYDVPGYKKLRVIVGTDAACEADDPFAIAHALMCRKFDVRAIFAEQFGGRKRPKRAMMRS